CRKNGLLRSGLGQNLLLPHHSIVRLLHLQQRTLRPLTLVHRGRRMISPARYAAARTSPREREAQIRHFVIAVTGATVRTITGCDASPIIVYVRRQRLKQECFLKRSRPAMIVCSCNVLSDSDVRRVVSIAAHTVSQVYKGLGCSAQCGRCAHTIKKIVQDSKQSLTSIVARCAMPGKPAAMRA